MKHCALSVLCRPFPFVDAVDHSNQLFRLVVVACGLFIVTVLAMVASLFSKPGSPLPVFLDEYGRVLILWEVTAVLGIALLALVVDRLHSRRRTVVHKGIDADKSDRSTGIVRDED